jgi:hypothetical protein
MTKRIDWKLIDWTQHDIVLSEQHGCTREAVRQARQRAGRPKITECLRRIKGGTTESRIRDIDTTDMTLEEIALKAECGQAHTRIVLEKLGKTFKRLHNYKAKYDWSLFPSNWKDMTDAEIGKIVGCENPAVVAQWRFRKGFIKNKRNEVKSEESGNAIPNANPASHEDPVAVP